MLMAVIHFILLDLDEDVVLNSFEKVFSFDLSYRSLETRTFLIFFLHISRLNNNTHRDISNCTSRFFDIGLHNLVNLSFLFFDLYFEKDKNFQSCPNIGSIWNNHCIFNYQKLINT